MVKNFFKNAYAWLIYFFLYAPIAVMIVLSFNASRSRTKWGGFTLDWYKALVDDEAVDGVWYDDGSLSLSQLHLSDGGGGFLTLLFGF